MTGKQFRRMALRCVDVVESSHMGHADFRVGGKIFATLNADETLGMVKLTPDQQRSLVEAAGNVFRPCNGAWGRAGCTHVELAVADLATVESALQLAHENVAATLPPARRKKSASEKTLKVSKRKKATKKKK